MDFDDLLLYTNILFRDYPDVLDNYRQRFAFILVDEYQDTNFAQHLIVKRLAEKHQRISVVGDDAQSIYSFRGANIDNILKFKNHFPDSKLFKLEQNYRSTQNIVAAANSLIQKNKAQIQKNVFSENAKGQRIQVFSAMAQLLAREVSAIPQVKITQKVDANGVFALIPPAIVKPLEKEFPFYLWDEQTCEARWMCSFDTTEEEIITFVDRIRELCR